MKKLVVFLFAIVVSSCGELQQIANQLPGAIGNDEIAEGLRQALNSGIDKQVNKLTKKDGFFRNEMVRILLPDELKKVDKTLRDIGLSALADEGLKLLNRAAEDAVKEATPIFVDAVKGITFGDAKDILLGDDKAATSYLQGRTKNSLYKKFSPVIKNSLDEVNATKVWKDIITKYNSIPLTRDVNPDLTDYVTDEALKGVYTMIAVEEGKIRNNINSRTTDLLRKVFALQDK